MKKNLFYTGCLLALMGYACKHQPIQDPAVVQTPLTPIPPDTTTNNEIPCSADTVYFRNEILPLLVSGCTMSGCHNEASHADGVILTSYEKIMQTADIKPGNSSKSDLYEAITEDDEDKIMPRPPYNPLTSEQILKVKKWIDQGAKNNYCDACDTTNDIRYAAHIAPLLQLHCTGCHSAGAPGGGYDLTNYNTVAQLALNKHLKGAVNHESGYSPMPQNAAKLSVCNIAKIEKWIQQGALNN